MVLGDHPPVHRVREHVLRLVRRGGDREAASTITIAETTGASGSVPRVQPSAMSSTHDATLASTSEARSRA